MIGVPPPSKLGRSMENVNGISAKPAFGRFPARPSMRNAACSSGALERSSQFRPRSWWSSWIATLGVQKTKSAALRSEGGTSWPRS